MQPCQHGGAVWAAIYQITNKNAPGFRLWVTGGDGGQHQIQQIGAAMQIADDAERLHRAGQGRHGNFAG